MKADLSFKECENLKKWGLDQTLREGDWYFFTAKVPSIERQSILHILAGVGSPYVKLPSAEEIWDFLGQKCLEVEQVFFSDHIVFKARDLPRGDWPTSREVKMNDGWGKNLSQALYALCQKVFGGKERQ